MSSAGVARVKEKQPAPVLWMDDEKDVVSYFKSFIEKESSAFAIRVHFVTTIDQAREELRSGRYAALIADCRMDPYDLSVNGAEFLREVTENYRSLPLFVFSAYTGDPHYEEHLAQCPIVSIASKAEDIERPLSNHYFFKQLNYWATRFYKVKDYFPERIEFRKYILEPTKFADEASAHWQKHGAWIQAEMKRLNYGWVVVVGEAIVMGSSDIREYPNEERLREIGNEYNLIPFAYGTSPQPEEIGDWHQRNGYDWYPTFAVQIGSLMIEDDFDTGALHTHVSDKVVQRGPFDFSRQSGSGLHLGTEYGYFMKKIPVTIIDSAGGAVRKEVTVTVVDNWETSSFRHVNPSRQCLIGRDLLISFDMMVVLDTPRRRTVVRHLTDVRQSCPFKSEESSGRFCSLDAGVTKKSHQSGL